MLKFGLHLETYFKEFFFFFSNLDVPGLSCTMQDLCCHMGDLFLVARANP